VTINNPYWEAVKDCVETDGIRGNPVVGYFRLDRTSVRTLPARRTGWGSSGSTAGAFPTPIP
jgi:hypothetical protein